MEKQRLILLFDGTWNDPTNQTNVYRIAGHILEYDESVRQKFFYDPGVGTGNLDQLRGGVFGYGLSKNLIQGYEWLAKRYTDLDEIWVFGYSRGAYTARSLVGLIRKCGLLRIVTPKLLEEAENIYRDKKLHPDSEQCREFRLNYGRDAEPPRIRFIGVWDTVGALGIPGTNISESGRYAWHDTTLSSHTDYAYQAVALDEHRFAYDVSLWTSDDGLKKPKNIEVEQRWFIGAHSNVGGGNGSSDLLADISLQWMMEKASSAGLKMRNFTARNDAWKSNPTDSYKNFVKGVYAIFRSIKTFGNGRHYRSFKTGKDGKPAVNVTVDQSVWLKWKDEVHYRPRTLLNAGLGVPRM